MKTKKKDIRKKGDYMTPTEAEIDGWRIVKPNDPDARQEVNGVWYAPIFVCDSMEMALDQVKAHVLSEVLEAIEKMENTREYTLREDMFGVGYDHARSELRTAIKKMNI